MPLIFYTFLEQFSLLLDEVLSNQWEESLQVFFRKLNVGFLFLFSRRLYIDLELLFFLFLALFRLNLRRRNRPMWVWLDLELLIRPRAEELLKCLLALLCGLELVEPFLMKFEGDLHGLSLL